MLKPTDKARLSWHCRRGMLELDLILQRFFERQIDSLSEEHIHSFDFLLSSTDPELFAWLMGHEEPQDPRLKEIVAIIRNND